MGKGVYSIAICSWFPLSDGKIVKSLDQSKREVDFRNQKKKWMQRRNKHLKWKDNLRDQSGCERTPNTSCEDVGKSHLERHDVVRSVDRQGGS